MPYSVLTGPSASAAPAALEGAGILASLAPNRPLDRSLEDQIDQRAWTPVSRAIEAATRTHLGDKRADALQKHHNNVLNIASTYDWVAARTYDIKEREAYAADPSIDISMENSERVALIAASFYARCRDPPDTPAPYTRNHTTRRLQAAPRDQYPRKRPRTEGAGSHCFRCGRSDPPHMPANCAHTTTIAGRPCAPIHTASTSPHALAAPSGAAYCFQFAVQSACRGAHCANHHGCSICGVDGSHGARACPRA